MAPMTVLGIDSERGEGIEPHKYYLSKCSFSHVAAGPVARRCRCRCCQLKQYLHVIFMFGTIYGYPPSCCCCVHQLSPTTSTTATSLVSQSAYPIHFAYSVSFLFVIGLSLLLINPASPYLSAFNR